MWGPCQRASGPYKRSFAHNPSGAAFQNLYLDFCLYLHTSLSIPISFLVSVFTSTGQVREVTTVDAAGIDQKLAAKIEARRRRAALVGVEVKQISCWHLNYTCT